METPRQFDPSSGMTLEAAGLGWLRFDRLCKLTVMQRGIHHHHKPDLLGVDKRNVATEIEIKRTLSDFKADRKKRTFAQREHGLINVRQFYYLVPPKIEELVIAELPKFAGLLVCTAEADRFTGLPVLRVRVNAPVNKLCRPLYDHQIQTMIAAQTATMHRLLLRIVREEASKPGQ